MIGRVIRSDASVAEGAAFLADLNPRFAAALRQTGTLPLRLRKDGFEQLFSAIISQQVSVASAAAIWRRLKDAKLTGPRKVLNASDEDLRSCGLSRQKIRYAKALADAQINFKQLRTCPNDQVLATLVEVPGIGSWTAEVYAMFSLGRADVFAPGDLALQEAARLLFDLDARPTEKEFRVMAEAWAPWRAVAARLLWAYYRIAKDREGIRMTRILESGLREAASGDATSVVVFLHGYGANGADLLGLADPLAPHMPDTLFLAPDAPEICATNPGGFQWFPIPWIDGSSEDVAEVSMQKSVEDLNAYLDQVLDDEDMEPRQMILFGFSQGTMMSLHVAPRREEEVAGVVGFSGRLLQAESLIDDTVSKPPILLVHGDQDELVTPQSMPEAGNALIEAGFEVFAHVMEGTGHGIAPDGLSVALAFMRDKLRVSD